MVEITQEEFERLTGIEKKYNELVPKHEELTTKHEELTTKHNELKDDYISICKGQRGTENNNADEFDAVCNEKFDNKK